MFRNAYTYEKTGHLLIFMILNCEGLELYSFSLSLIAIDLPISAVNVIISGSLSNVFYYFCSCSTRKNVGKTISS